MAVTELFDRSTVSDESELQLCRGGRLRHLLTLRGLSREQLTDLMDRAESFLSPTGQRVIRSRALEGRTVANLFFEPSTRTRASFDLAAKRLAADVLNLDVNTSSRKKGESILDMIYTLQAMQVDVFVIRDASAGVPAYIARNVNDYVSILNAGEADVAHPTQGLLDLLTIRQHKADFENLSVAIVGDILHSRVARSLIHALNILGAPDVRVVAPRTLLPTEVERLGVRPCTDMREGLKDVDVVMMLRLQRERMQGSLIASEQEYFNLFGLTRDKLAYAKPDVLVMHPGPINRGLEIASDVADGEHSVILSQVTNGIAVRMSVMAILMGGRQRPDR